MTTTKKRVKFIGSQYISGQGVTMKKNITLKGRTFGFTYEEDSDIEMLAMPDENGVSCFTIIFKWKKPCFPKKISLEWDIPAINVYYMWDALEKERSLPYFARSTQSRVAYGMPLKSLASKKSRNVCTIALSDVKTPLSLNMRGDCTSGLFHIGVDFFTMQAGPFERYETTLWIDERALPLAETVKDAVNRLKAPYECDYPTPESARLPMYSTWYSYMQTITAEKALEECREAVKYGMKTIIVDDGWQIERSDGAYGSCGDWQPVESKFPDMKDFTKSVHALGMKVMLWYAVPFIGKNAEIYPEFIGKYLYDLDSHNCSVLDPRYPQVRRYLIDTYVNAVEKYNLDGLKLDFIDRFKTNGVVTADMDYSSVEEAVSALLKQISVALHEIKPDIMIEFRQPYFGPVISTYGNMMRVWDCPLDGNNNKTQTINLRLVSGKCAVHADMMYWHPCDAPESVACQLWGTMFAVPQISARMNTLTGGQSLVLNRFLGYVTENADLLTRGGLDFTLCENGYDKIETGDKNKRICLLSHSPVIALDNRNSTDAINLTDSETLFIRNDKGEKLSVAAFDCTGKRTVELTTSDVLFTCPVQFGGMMCVLKN